MHSGEVCRHRTEKSRTKMLTEILSFVVLGSLPALASPVAQASMATSTTATACVPHATSANFDDLTPPPLNLPLMDPPHGYGGLDWNATAVAGSDLLNQEIAPIFLAPESPPNYVFFDATTQIYDGRMVMNIYPPYKYFNMTSLYYSCAIINGLASIPLDCTVEFTGEKTNDGAVSTSAEFEGRALTTRTMNKVVFPSDFVHLRRLSFSVSGAVTDVITRVYFDSMSYTLGMSEFPFHVVNDFR